MCVVIFGSLQNGILTVHGPFFDANEALEWAKIHSDGGDYVIMPLRDKQGSPQN